MKPLEPPFIKIIIKFVTQEEHDNSHYANYNKDWIFEQMQKILKKKKKIFKKWHKINHKLLREQIARCSKIMAWIKAFWWSKWNGGANSY